MKAACCVVNSIKCNKYSMTFTHKFSSISVGISASHGYGFLLKNTITGFQSISTALYSLQLVLVHTMSMGCCPAHMCVMKQSSSQD